MKKILNIICVALGFLFIAIGVVGIVLPVLPTTPFLLLALILFAKGSEHFHQWFMGTLLYKKYVETYMNTKELPVKAKRNVLITVTILFTIGFIFSPVLWAKIIIVIGWVAHLYFFLFRIKTAENPKESNDSKPKKKGGFWTKFLSTFLFVCLLVYLLNGGWSNEDRKEKQEVKAESTIENGVYTIPASLWHITNNNASMGNGALHQTGKLVIEDGQATLYLYMLQFSMGGLTGNLMELNLLDNIVLDGNNYPQSYDLINGTAVSTYAIKDPYNASDSTDPVSAGKLYPKVIGIPVTTNKEYIFAQVYIPVMGSLGFGNQLCRIKLDYAGIEKMSDEQLQEWSAYETNDTEGTDDGGGGTVETDKSILKEKLDLANTLITQTEVYTDASLSNLKAAIDNATKVYANEAANQEGINDQVTKLQAAMDALAKKSTENLDKNQLADGKYNVNMNFWHATNDTASMGNAAINSLALLTVKNSVYTLEFSTRPMTFGTITACLQSVQIQQADKTYANADITAKNNSIGGVPMPSAFSFVLPAKEEYLNIKIDPKVAIMGNEPLPARIKISWDTLKKIADDATVQEDTKEVTVDEELPAVDIKDKSTKVRIKAGKNILAKGVRMTVSEITSGTDYQSIKSLITEIGTKFTAYDITLYNENGAKVEPNGMVSVYIPLPNNYDSDKIMVYRINDTAKTKLSTTIEDGYIVFQTSGFSTFAVVDASSTQKKTLPPTKKNATLPTKKPSSTVGTKKSNLTKSNNSNVAQNKGIQGIDEVDNQAQSDGLNIEQAQDPQILQVIQSDNGLTKNEIITTVLLVTSIVGSMVIMLFIIGFILIDRLLRRKK